MKFFKKIFLIILIFLTVIPLLISFTSCLHETTEKITEKTIEETTITEEIEETTIESVEEETEEKTTEEIIKDFFVGETLIAENFCELTIHSVENYVAKSEYMQPEEGFRLIAVDVEVKNISNEVQSYNVLNYEAQDSDGYVYEHGFHENKEPYFGSGDISSGQTRRAWVTIPVKEDSEIVAIIAQPLYKTSPTTIKLHTPLKP